MVGTALHNVSPFPTPSHLDGYITTYGEVSLQQEFQNLNRLSYRHPSVDVYSVAIGEGVWLTGYTLKS